LIVLSPREIASLEELREEHDRRQVHWAMAPEAWARLHKRGLAVVRWQESTLVARITKAGRTALAEHYR